MASSQNHSSQTVVSVHEGGSTTQTGSSVHDDGQQSTNTELSPELAWSQQNLLSLDGGGIRGYWTLLVLQRLMNEIAKEEKRLRNGGEEDHSFSPLEFPEHVTQGPPDDEEKRRKRAISGTRASTWKYVHDSRKFLPCHYFDYICGSSTGALIAIMLGRFRMPVWDCLREYESMSHSIFGKPRIVSQRNIGIVRWPRYSANALERAFKEVTARRCEETSQNNVTFSAPSDICKTFVTAFAYERKKGAPVKEQRLYLLRTYKHEKRQGINMRDMRRNYTGMLNGDKRNYGSADDWPIWRIARAATAAPMYFKELPEKRHMRDGETTIYFSDGGFGETNNPTFEGITEIKSLHGGKENIGVVVNVGTSRGTIEAGGRSIFKRVHGAFDRATDPTIVAGKVEGEDLPHYWRFDDEAGIGVDLDEWKPNGYFTKHPGVKTLADIRAKFNEWVVERENGLQKCAKELVARRRARILNLGRWEAYATNASFACNHGRCSSKAFDDRVQLQNHLRREHSVSDMDIASMVNDGTKMWQYQDQ